MSITNFKKVLLAGTALVAVSAFGAQAQAAAFAHTAAALTSGATGTWANTTNGVQAQATSASIATAGHGDTVNLAAGATLTVTNNATADDGSANANTFDLGAVTNTALTGNVTITTGGNNALTVTGTSVDVGGNVGVVGTNVAAGAITTTFSGNVTAGGTFAADNALQNAGAVGLAVTVGGNLAVTSTSIVKGGAFAGAATGALTVTGNSAFTGGMTVTGGANAAATATLTLNGATNTGAIVLTNGVAGGAILNFSGTAAQTVAGAISGTGSMVVNNANGVTFASTVAPAAITINKTAGNSAATFKGAVTSTVNLGADASATDTNTVTFDGTTAGFTLTGGIVGAQAVETNNIVVSGGNTITFAGAGSTSNLDNLTISGTSTKLTTGQNLTLGTLTTVGSGSTLTTTANTVTSAIANSGTVVMGGGNITGALDGGSSGVGALSVTAAGTLTGSAGGTTKLASITVADNIALTVSAAGAARTIQADTILLDGTTNDATIALTLGNTVTFKNAVTTTTTSKGIITGSAAAGVITFEGAVGTSTKSLKAITLADNAGASGITTGSNLYVDTITLGQADVLLLNGATTQVISGAVNGATSKGDISVTGTGTIADFKGVVGGTTLATLTTANGSTAIFEGNATFAGAATNGGGTSGTITVYPNKTLTTVGWTSGAASTLNLNVSNTAGNAVAGNQLTGKLSNTGAVTLTGSTINFNVASTSAPLIVGTVANAIVSNVGVTLPAAALQTDNSFLYNLRLTANGTNADLTISAGNTIAATSTTTGNTAVGGVLQTTLATSTNAGINALQGAMASATSADAVNEVLESAQPTVDGSASVAAMDNGAQVQGVLDVRMASLRTGNPTSGVAAGASANGYTMWLQGYGVAANADQKDGIDGYDSRTYGGAVGVDSSGLMNNGVVGLAFNYGKTNADSDNANTTETDVNSYGISLYGNYDIAQNTFLSGILGYAHNRIDTDRHNAQGPGSGVTAEGDTDSNQWSAKVALGRDYAADHGLTLSPAVSASYVHLSTDGYTETGAGGASLIVGDSDAHSLKFGLGGAATWNLKNSDGSVMKPQLRAGYTYEATNDRVDVSSAFTGDAAGTAFLSQGAEVDRHAVNVGAGLTYMTTANWDLSANYDYTWKANYNSHAGVLRATSHF